MKLLIPAVRAQISYILKKLKEKMEIIRKTQCGQCLPSIIKFKAVNYVFGKKEIKEHPWNARNCLEMCGILSSRGAEFFGTCKSMVQLSNNFALKAGFQKQLHEEVGSTNS